MEKIKKNSGNYRRAGLIMTPFVLLGLLIAYLANAPTLALTSIGVFGLGCALILIILGNRGESNNTKSN